MLKESILQELKEKKHTILSGQELADRYQVSRNAVWKAIHALQKEGYPIQTEGRKGYRLLDHADLLTETAVRAALPDSLKQMPIRIFQSIDSTNSEALRMLADGFSSHALLITENQTNGMGHNGTVFHSPTASGLYMTCILHRNISFGQLSAVSRGTALAVVKSLNRRYPAASHLFQIRNIQDIYDGEHKVCGILSQALTRDLESGYVQDVCIGIGIYLQDLHPTPKSQDLPSDFSYIGSSADRSLLAAEITAKINSLDFEHPESFLEEYHNCL